MQYSQEGVHTTRIPGRYASSAFSNASYHELIHNSARRKSEELGVVADNDSWLSDLESETDLAQEDFEVRKSRKSSSSSKAIKCECS